MNKGVQKFTGPVDVSVAHNLADAFYSFASLWIRRCGVAVFALLLFRFVLFFCQQEPLSKTPDFYAANDRMTETLRGPLLTAQREVAALDIRRRKILEKVCSTETEEKTAYIAATNWQETLQNTAKKAGFVSHHAKLKTELGMVEVQIKDFKQVFGMELFQVLVDLEDMQGWLPTVRDIRSIYDQCRRDVEKIHVRRKEKEVELSKLGGVPMVNTSETSKRDNNNINGAGDVDDDPQKPSYFKQVAAAEAGPPQSTLTSSSSAAGYGSSSSIAAAAAPAMYSSNGGPLSYSLPQATPQDAVSASRSTSQSNHNDPFQFQQQPQQQQYQQQYQHQSQTLSGNGTLAYPQQQQPQHNIDTFASGGSGHDSFGSLAPMGTGGSFMAAPSSYDPFSFSTPANSTSNNNFAINGSIDSQQQQSHQQMQYSDPFASLGSNSGNGATQAPPPTNDNPLFRF